MGYLDVGIWSEYEYEIIYKKGGKIVVVNALFRQIQEEGSLIALSLLVLGLLEEENQEWMMNATIQALIQRL